MTLILWCTIIPFSISILLLVYVPSSTLNFQETSKLILSSSFTLLAIAFSGLLITSARIIEPSLTSQVFAPLLKGTTAMIFLLTFSSILSLFLYLKIIDSPIYLFLSLSFLGMALGTPFVSVLSFNLKYPKFR